MWSFPGSMGWKRSLCLVLVLSTCWSSARGWVMFSLREHDYRDVAVQIPPHQMGGIPLNMPRSSSSISRKVTSAHSQGDLRITVRASPSSASPRASHSSSTSQHLVFPDELAGSSDRVEPSISFGGPVDDRMLIAALEGELDSGDDYSILHAPSEKEHTLREALLLLGHWRGGLQ